VSASAPRRRHRTSPAADTSRGQRRSDSPVASVKAEGAVRRRSRAEQLLAVGFPPPLSIPQRGDFVKAAEAAAAD